MELFFRVASWTPIGSYAVSKDFERRWIIVCLAIASLLTYASLTVWNVFTQGKVDTYTSIVFPAYLSTRNTSCSPAVLDVGNLLYSSPTGTFNWIIQAVDNGVKDEFATALQYTGSSMTANVTSFGLTYSFTQQAYKYGICANATFNEPANRDKSFNIAQPNTIVITLCTDYDLSTANLPPWTLHGQQQIQNLVFGLSKYFQRLSIPNGTFPSTFFPPYNQPSSSPPIMDTSVSPAKVLDVSMWMGGFSYLPGKDGNTSHDIILEASSNVLNITQAFHEAYDAGLSGFLLALTGIGGLMLNATANEPTVVTDMRTDMLSFGDTIMNLASADLNNRTLGASYLCTIKRSMFTGILAGMVVVAQYYDTRVYRRVDVERAQLPLLPLTPAYNDVYR